MKIKDAIYERCPTCNYLIKTIEEECFGCDFCKKPIDLKNDKYNNRVSLHLEVTIFYKSTVLEKAAKHLQFCSWKCLYSKLKKLENRKDIDFISLPYLSFERDIKDKYCGDFFECIKLRSKK